MKLLRDLPSAAYIAEALHYDAVTGDLRWRARPATHFKGVNPERTAAATNKRWAGKSAFTFQVEGKGRQGNLNGSLHRAHRVIWKLVHNEDPEVLTPIDGDHANLRLNNWLHTSHTARCKNTACRTDNTSGARGVTWNTPTQSWRAQIKSNGHYKWLGLHKTVEAASAAYEREAARIGFKAYATDNAGAS